MAFMAKAALMMPVQQRKDREYRGLAFQTGNYSDEELRTRYRFGRVCIAYLRNILQGDLQRPTNKGIDKSTVSRIVLGGFPKVIGCVDGTHIRIQAPSRDEPAYVNRKGYHSINVQAVCDHEGKFTNICAKWPGAAHDSHIFRTSSLCALMERTHTSISDGFILGDNGYPCRPFLLTPYLNPQGRQQQQRYNDSLCATRVTIERTFGRWKRRFHVLHS